MTTEPVINVEKIVQHWTRSAEEDYETFLFMLESNRNAWALFIGHLALEKLLKAHYVRQTGQQAPLIHNLARIAERADIVLTPEQLDWLNHITTFNLNTRYDDYKQSFYKLCTRAYTEYWAEIIKQLRLWIKQL